MVVGVGRGRGPDIVLPIVEVYDWYCVWVRREGHSRTSGVNVNSFVREWSIQVSMRHDAEDGPQPAVYLDLQLSLPKISPFLHEWLKLNGTLPPTL